MKISVIMIDGGFREYIFALEYFSHQDFPSNEYEIIWVEYYDRPHPDLKKYPGVKVKTLNQKGMYHSSYCFNGGIKEAKGEVLVIPDADVMVEKDFLSTAYEEHSKNHELVMYFHRYCQTEEFFKENNFSFDYVKSTSRYLKSSIENYGGCLSVRKRWLLEIGGYEQHRAFATGNHANGKDVYTRLKNLGLYVKWHPHQYLYHPWHPGTGGVGADQKRVKWQNKIIKYRAFKLMTNAFEGLGGSCTSNCEIPSPPLGDPDQ
jgi:hypothetical protein